MNEKHIHAAERIGELLGELGIPPREAVDVLVGAAIGFAAYERSGSFQSRRSEFARRYALCLNALELAPVVAPSVDGARQQDATDLGIAGAYAHGFKPPH